MDLLQFELLKTVPNFQHALTMREGGVSCGGFESLNLAFHVGDNLEHVRQNRQILAREIGFDLENLVAAQQVHGNSIHIAPRSDAGRGALDWETAIPETDALITSEKQLPLLILVADCAPVLLICPQKQVLAVVHAGWRGALLGIAGKAALEMQTAFECAPEDILAGVGPCLSVENLEIGPEVAAQIAEVDEEAIVSGWPKPHLDLRGLIERDLMKSGVLQAHIETMPFCTKSDARFFSHRGQNGVAGRFGLVAWFANPFAATIRNLPAQVEALSSTE